MSNVLKLSGPLKVGSLGTAPSNPQEGFIYFDTNSGTFQFYQNGGFRQVSAEAIAAHLTDDASLKHDANEIDYERADGSRKNIQADATSAHVEAALNDLDDSIGALDQTPTNYTAADPGIVADHLAGIDSALATSGSTEFSDSDFRVQDNADPTKQIALEASAITTATTRTITMPDANVDLGKVNTAIQRDGSVPFTANQPMGTNKLTGLAAGTTGGDSVRYEQAILISGANAFAANQSMGSNRLTSVADPVADQDAATKAYVDAMSSGLDVKKSVRLATAAALPANTPAGTGVGKTLTADANGALSVDGTAVAVGNRILVKDEVAGDDNGIYTVTATGDGSNPFVLTRAIDFDQDAEVTGGAFTFIEEGSTNADTGWVLTTNNPITVDTTALTFVQFSGAGQVVAGNGLTKTGNTLDVGAGNGISVGADSVAVNSDVTGGANLARVVNVSANGVAIRIDDTTIGENGSQRLEVKDSAITDAKVATGANIDAAKLGTGSVDNTEFGYLNGVTSAIQTQINGKIGSVAEDTDPELGGDLDVSGFAIEGAASPVLLAGQNSVRRAKQASKSSFVEEEYIHATTLVGSQTNTVIAALTFAFASYEGMEITYKIRQTSTNNVRIGTVRVVTNGTAVVLNDVFTDSADLGISFSAAVNGSNIEIRYSSGANGGTLRMDVKKILT